MTCTSCPSTSILTTSGFSSGCSVRKSSIDVVTTRRAVMSTRSTGSSRAVAGCWTCRCATPVELDTAEATTTTLENALRSTLSRSAATFSGSGSNATTDPDAPTSRAPRIVKKPTLAPTSKKTDRKSTRLNSSHLVISYAVFCLKKKKKKKKTYLNRSTTC